MSNKPFDLGINSESIQFEVALDVLCDTLRPYVEALAEERKKPQPSEAFVHYCQACVAAIGALQDDLRPDDRETITMILQRQGPFSKPT